MVTNQFNSASQASEQRYRHLFVNMPICIFVVNLTVSPATILEVNKRTELVYGFTAAELVGNPVTYLVPEESRTSLHNILRRVQRGETVTIETTTRHRDGTIFPVRVIATLDPTNSGRMITVVEDITTERQRRSESEAIEAERLRIAHEIHDGVAQSLAGLRFKSALWSHLADSAPPPMHAALEELQVGLNIAIADLRRAIFALRPVDLETLGLIPALRQWVADFGEQNQLAAEFDTTGSNENLPVAYELPLFRIIQEGLNNINQHASASSVRVSLTVDAAGGVALSLRDNGCGFDPNMVGKVGLAEHFGLRHIRERVLDLGGTLDIRSAIGQGTELLITLPPTNKEINITQNTGAHFVSD